MQLLNNNNKSKSVAFIGVLSAFALILSYIESLIPFYFGIPGMKLGLANAAIVMILYMVGAVPAIIVSIIRVIVCGFLFGNAFSIVYSLSGAILSFLFMLVLKKTGKLGVIPVSIAGGITHNLGQIIVAILIVDNFNLVFYFPVLFIAGAITGAVIGLISQEIIIRLKAYNKEL